MCSICDYTKYTPVNGRLEKPLGTGSLVIRCDEDGKNYKLGTNTEKDEFVVNKCPTCGKRLF